VSSVATGLATSRRDLSVWVVTGDGDALSIGGNHLIHALRRNVNITILLFNNQVYGLTKGQYSPTSPVGQRTGSTPMGSIDHPFNPLSVALGAEASFVARSIDTDRKHLTEVLRAASKHKGASFVEIYQNCNVFNDGAFDAVRAKGQREANQIRLEQGELIRFGADNEKGLIRHFDGHMEIVDVDDVGEDALMGRIYLPAEDLARFGYAEDEVFESVVDARFVALMEFQIARVRSIYLEAEPGIAMLSPESRYTVRLALSLYRRILERIEANDFDVFRRRAYVPFRAKMLTALPVAFAR